MAKKQKKNLESSDLQKEIDKLNDIQSSYYDEMDQIEYKINYITDAINCLESIIDEDL